MLGFALISVLLCRQYIECMLKLTLTQCHWLHLSLLLGTIV